MTIVHLLEKNAREFPNDVALVEINPEQPETRRITWSEFELVESSARRPYRREITWSVFEEKANRFANMLSNNGIGKGNKVAILLMNCIDWLPIYFGILKTGALVVPLNFRYSSDEIDYCLDLSEADVLVFGNEFVIIVCKSRTACTKIDKLTSFTDFIRYCFNSSYEFVTENKNISLSQIKTIINFV